MGIASIIKEILILHIALIKQFYAQKIVTLTTNEEVCNILDRQIKTYRSHFI
jgi:hypothetical protein